MKSVKKKGQRGNEHVYDELRGQQRKIIMGENECQKFCSNWMILLLFSSLACVAAVACVELVSVIEFTEEEVEQKSWWVVFTVFLNSIIVSILTKMFNSVVEYIVERENHGSQKNHEESLVRKSLIMSSFISFGGLMLASFWEREFWIVNLLMMFLIIFKQILLNAIEAC